MRVYLPFFSKQKAPARNACAEASASGDSRKQQRGFTLLELLVVTAIVAILLLIVLARLNLFGRQVDIEATAQQIISTLQAARTQTLASEDESVYGVHFEASKYVLFKGATYNPSDTTNKEYNLSSVEIYPINLAGGVSDVIFTRIRGSTVDTGNIGIRLTADTSRTRTIVINSLGQASIEEAVSPVDTRIVDTRHLHFDPCLSIQNAITLRLTFADPTVVNNVVMASYFNADKSEFNWEGVTDVGGSNQTIKVHTHFLDASNSILSIHRDGMKNDKAVLIEMVFSGGSTYTIVSYEANGDATAGSFCSNIEPQ
ncbi:MAG: hypothetical protein A2Z24_02890 [Candidatus Woykebacteria bacterium RBG_16_44_10]|uniref:Prepilin-type N-terminal cleavage/methylation domain-containing protein n=1 Tax=Candidatus Woykebacteria bacterium RBG_16_44_10 TaxID=1802597 RepID=A0A1G1WCK0_9BACT|nr:MAG: hypothetical protein A2Z24_02890 [Candidatus Woykebacteria bacterium RBG_16_44_10]